MTTTKLYNITPENARKVMCSSLISYFAAVDELGLVKRDIHERRKEIYKSAREIALQTGQDLTDFPETFPPSYADLWKDAETPGLTDEDIDKKLELIKRRVEEDRRRYRELGKKLEERLGASSRKSAPSV
jgi:hypothetical protein